MDSVLLLEWKQNKRRKKLIKPKVERGFLKRNEEILRGRLDIYEMKNEVVIAKIDQYQKKM